MGKESIEQEQLNKKLIKISKQSVLSVQDEEFLQLVLSDSINLMDVNQDMATREQWLLEASELLEQGAEPNATEFSDLFENQKIIEGTALHHAVRNGHFDLAKLLILWGASVNAVDQFGCQPLHWAVRRQDGDMVALLLEAGARVNEVSNLDVTPLKQALDNEDCAILELLLKGGANVNAPDRRGLTPLAWAILLPLEENIILTLILGGASVEKTLESAQAHIKGWTPEHSKKITDKVREVITRYEKVSGSVLWERSFPIRNDDSDLVKSMHAKIQNLQAKFKAELEPEEILEAQTKVLELRAAIQNGQDCKTLETKARALHVALHLKRSDKVFQVTKRALQDAIEKGDLDKVIQIVKNHPGQRSLLLNSKNNQGLTPLHQAVGASCLDIVEYLLKQGALACVVDFAGRSALDLAIHRHRTYHTLKKEKERDPKTLSVADLDILENGKKMTRIIYRLGVSGATANDAAFKERAQSFDAQSKGGFSEFQWTYPLFQVDRRLYTMLRILSQLKKTTWKDGKPTGVSVDEERFKKMIQKSREDEVFTLVAERRATFQADDRCCKLLEEALQKKADINVCDHALKRTALHVAAQAGDVSLVQWLLQNGAEMEKQDWRGQTAWDLALKKEHWEVLKCLDQASKATEHCGYDFSCPSPVSEFLGWFDSKEVKRSGSDDEMDGDAACSMDLDEELIPQSTFPNHKQF